MRCFRSSDQQIPYPTNMAFNHSTESYQIPTFKLKRTQMDLVPRYAERLQEYQLSKDGGVCDVRLTGEKSKQVSLKFLAAVLAHSMKDSKFPPDSFDQYRTHLDQCLKFLQRDVDYFRNEEQIKKQRTRSVIKKERKTRSVTKKDSKQEPDIRKIAEALADFIADQQKIMKFFNFGHLQSHVPTGQEVDVPKFVTEMQSWEDAASIMAAQPYEQGELDDGDENDIITQVTLGNMPGSPFEAAL